MGEYPGGERAGGSDDLDALVRRVDPDRWLSSRFIADEERRADVVALYAFDHELSQASTLAREPLAAEIRLTWWREALDEIIAGKPARGHPALAALAMAIRRRGLASAPLEAMIEARFEALDQPRFLGAEALETHIDATSGALMALALAVLMGADALAIRPAAQAWALAGLVRRRRESRIDRFPLEWSAGEPAARGRRVLAEARTKVADLPVEAFPAVAHLALAAPYLAGRRPLGLEKRLRLTWATLSGRV